MYEVKQWKEPVSRTLSSVGRKKKPHINAPDDINGFLQFVREEMYSGIRLQKFNLIRQMLTGEARGGYSAQDVRRILDGVSKGDMDIILGWEDEYIRSLHWSFDALGILNNPSKYDLKYGKGRTQGVIEEEQWGETSLRGHLETSNFTSCLGIACKVRNKLRVMHLVIVGSVDKSVYELADDVNAYIRSVVTGADEIVLFGCVDTWRTLGLLNMLKLPRYKTKQEYRGPGEGESWQIGYSNGKVTIKMIEKA